MFCTTAYKAFWNFEKAKDAHYDTQLHHNITTRLCITLHIEREEQQLSLDRLRQ